ncbi:MAG TPA: ABC transporter substrate-binding protein [Thermoanaerobaculia bacterium]|nr:ABC transporter substrate-binding protein [Thermoanaerobaculia bacterium]
MPPRRCLGMFLAAAVTTSGCGAPHADEGSGTRRLSLIVPASETRFWSPIVSSFESAHPGVRVDVVEGPNSTDLRENLYTTALLAGDPSIDVVYMDVTWTAKFAAVGWLLPLEERVPQEETAAFLPAAIAAGRFQGSLYRLPTRIDVGMLYYRRDLLEARGLEVPRTFADLVATAKALQEPPDRWGFVWQGSQYEGLVCVFLEVLHGHGGFWIDPETLEVGLAREEALRALRFLRDLRRDGVSPPGVTTYTEEESRRLFQDGRAVFLRSWAYVFGLSQREGSPIAGKVGVALVPHAPGRESASTLGGWGLGVSRFTRHPELAAAFVVHATSLESQKTLCLPTGFAPARRDAYADPDLLAANPILEEIGRFQSHAVARPIIARYARASDILQRRLSAALSGLEAPEEALKAATWETRLLLGSSPRERAEAGRESR